MADFTLKGKVKIKSKTANKWQEWQENNILDEGQLGFISDKGYLVCGNNKDKNIYLEENIDLGSDKYQLDSITGKININSMGQLLLFVTAPMYGYGYTAGQDGGLIYKRTATDYNVPEGTILLLYDNYEDFDESIINPDDLRS